MRTKWSEKNDELEVSSPLSGIVTAMAPVEDVSVAVTPELNLDEDSAILLIKLDENNRLAGSIFSEVTESKYENTPDIEDTKKFNNLFTSIQGLVKDQQILSMHDISDGGLILSLIHI